MLKVSENISQNLSAKVCVYITIDLLSTAYFTWITRYLETLQNSCGLVIFSVS